MKTSSPNSPDECFVYSLKVLNRGAFTERKMIEKMQTRGYEDEVINLTINRLKNLKLIDDVKYAQDYIAYRSRSAPLGSRYLKIKLQQKGITSDLANESLITVDSEQELTNAKLAANKKMSQLVRYDVQKQKQKLYAFLVSRGFSQGIIYQIIKDLF